MPWATLLVGVLIYHRFTLASGFDLVQADVGDSRFVAFVLEHWYRVALGAEPWRSPPIFYPLRGTLGYSDASAAMGAVHALLRMAGLGVFTAMNVQLVLWSALSFGACCAFLRRGFRLPVGACCAGSYVFAFGWPRFAQLVHVQLQFTPLLPVMALLAPSVLRDGPEMGRWRGFALLAALAASWALLLATTVYDAQYFALGFVLALALCLVPADSRRHFGRVARRQAAPLVGAAVLLVVLLIPVWSIYGPMIRAGARRDWLEVAYYLADPIDLVWLGRENVVWGWLFSRFPEWAAHNWPERRIGAGLAVTLAWLAGIAWAARAAWRGGAGRPEACVILVGALLQLALLRLPGGVTLWWLIYKGFPGMNGVRAVVRLQLVIMLAEALAVAVVATRLWALGDGRRWVRAALVGAALFAAAEQLGSSNLYSARQAQALAQRVADAVPRTCPAFYVVPSGPLDPADAPFAGAVASFYEQTALLAAQFAGKPEVGGYSGALPPDYDLDNPFVPDVAARLGRWLARYGLPNDTVCVVPVRLRYGDLPQRTGWVLR